MGNHVELAQYLLASGADPNLLPPEEHLTAGGHSMTALAWACDMGDSEGGISRAGMVKCLLEGRARVDLLCTRGSDDLISPPLHRAILHLPVGALVHVLPLLLSQPESPSTMAMAATMGSRLQCNARKESPLGAAMTMYSKKYGAKSYEQHDKPDLESEEAQQTGTKRDGADVSKVTDYVEQQEMDHAKASKAIASLTDSMDTVDEEAEAKREKELAAVKINQERLPVPATRKRRHHRAARRMGRLSTHSFGPPLLQEDVDAIAQEMELDKAVAERKLREHNGDAVQTLVTLVSA